MSLINIESMTSAIDADAPCGEDLEYDPEFRELNEAVQGVPGEPGSEPAPPNWKDVRRRAEALFKRTRDLRIGCHLARAMLHTDGVPGLRDGLLVIRGMLENEWDAVHPLLDSTDKDDPTRSNALLALADATTMLADIRHAPLAASRVLGKFSLRSCLLASGHEQPLDEEPVPDPAHVEAAFHELEVEELTALHEAAEAAAEAIQAIESLVAENLGAPNAPDLSKSRQALGQVAKVVADQLEQRGITDVLDSSADTRGAAASSDADNGGSPVLNEIRSREEAVRMLDKVSEYFERNEPSSPVPLLLRRAQRLVAKSFIDILRDLTPGGVEQAESIGGLGRDE